MFIKKIVFVQKSRVIIAVNKNMNNVIQFIPLYVNSIGTIGEDKSKNLPGYKSSATSKVAFHSRICKYLSEYGYTYLYSGL